MNICIIGWYGSGTLGDRSILLGLAKVFNDTYPKTTIYLGSMNLFYSERCLFEDRNIYKLLAPNVKISLFDIKDKNEYRNIINKSYMVAMGGGPIMDLHELSVIQYGFRYAKKQSIKTALLGCGIGPLLRDKFKKIVADILVKSDLSIFRDPNSVLTANVIVREYGEIMNTPIYSLHDPAIIPIGVFKKYKDTNINNNNYLLISMRDFPARIFESTKNASLDQNFAQILIKLSASYEKIILAPMHTFSHGNDDRIYLSELKHMANCNNIEVIQKPLNVFQMFSLIKNASACIGMRYHSIVFQTYLNGKNAIIDYTYPGVGKIASYLDQINGKEQFKKLYINLHDGKVKYDEFIDNVSNINSVDPFSFDENVFDETSNSYSKIIKDNI